MWPRIVTYYLSGLFLFETRVLSAPRNKGRQFHEAQFIAARNDSVCLKEQQW